MQAVATGFRRYAAFRVARRAETDLRDRMFAHLQGLHFAYHDQAQTGQLMSRANTDLNQVQAFLVMIPLTLSNAAAVLAVVVVLVSIDPLLTLLAVGTLPVVNVVARASANGLHPEMVDIQAESAELASVVEETVSGVRVVKGFGAEDDPAAALRRRGRRRLRRVDAGHDGAGHATGRCSSCCPRSGSSPRSATAATRCSTGA